jgi:hypothetical protein
MMFNSFAQLKRALQPGVVVTMTRRDYAPMAGGYDAIGIARRIVIAQTNAIAFESIRPDTDRPSWLYWPKASEVDLLPDGFRVKGLTYRVDTQGDSR